MTDQPDNPRCEQRVVVTVVAIIMGPVLVFGMAGLGIVLFLNLDWGWESLAVLVVFIGGSAFIAYHMLQNYHWVEFDGRFIRGKRFWTRIVVEQEIQDLTALRPLQGVPGNNVTPIIDSILGDNRGWEFKFRKGPSIAVIRHDMKDVDRFMRAVTENWVSRNRNM